MSEVKPNRTNVGLAVFLGLHLILVGVSGFRGFLISMNDADLTKVKMNAYPHVVEQYGSIFAASQGFGFYAPGVASETRVEVLGCKRGVSDWRSLTLGLKGESQHFFNSFVGIGLRTTGRKPVAQSIAAYAMSKYPDVDTVMVNYQAELIPSLREEGFVAREWKTLESNCYYR